MARDDSLAGRTAIVTGGSRGIGFAIAQALHGHGASVAVLGRSAEDLDAAVGKLGERAIAVKANVGDAGDAARAVDEAARRLGGLDVLVNNAGVGIFANVSELPPDDWNTVIATNLSGSFYCSRAAIPHLRRRGGGWIVNVSSLAGKNPFVGGSAYCASKAGLNAFSEALMQEVRHDGIRVTCIAPGSVATGFGGRSAPDTAAWKIQPEDVGRLVIDLLTMPPRTLPSAVDLRPSRPPQK